MNWHLFALLFLLLAPKPEPAIELVEATARREDQTIAIDGRVRNYGDKEARKLMIYFEVLDGDRKVLTRQSGAIEEPELAPGAEAEFHNQISTPARAVSVRFEFEDASGRELKTRNNRTVAIE